MLGPDGALYITTSNGSGADEYFTANLAYSNPGLPYLLEGDLTATVTVTDDISSTVDLRLSGSGSPFRVSRGMS